MGLLFLSLTVTLTSGCETRPFASSTSAIFCSRLHFGESGDMQAHGHQRDADGTGLADTHVAAKFLHIEDFDGDQIAISDDVIVRRHARSCGELANAIIRLLWRLENGLRAAGRRQNH